jgi:hypothetical protein
MVSAWWLENRLEQSTPAQAPKPRSRKCPEINVLHNHEAEPSKDFWIRFPAAPIPTEVISRINTTELQSQSCKVKNLSSNCELAKAEKSLQYLRNGAPSFQKKPLGPCMVKNSKAAYVHGVEVTDSIASWLKGILGGLFFAPPLANFRSNSILAIPQANKVRICINVSLPKDNSLNRNITVSPSAQIDVRRILVSSIPLVYDGNRFLRFLY